MTLWEIDNAIAALVDPDTGELQDYEAFEALSMEREKKIENMVLVMKNAKATSAALKAEIDNLTARRKAAERTVARMKDYIEQALAGQKFETPRCVISYRKSTAVETDLEFTAWARDYCSDILLEQAPKVDLVALKERLNGGMDCPYARIVERQNIQVK